MKITPIEIASSGPGGELSNLPSGLSIKMADPVEDFKYAFNTVTLTYDLSQYSQVRLRFEAKEYGDEPHAPPSNPFTGEQSVVGAPVFHLPMDDNAARAKRSRYGSMGLAGRRGAIRIMQAASIARRGCRAPSDKSIRAAIPTGRSRWPT